MAIVHDDAHSNACHLNGDRIEFRRRDGASEASHEEALARLNGNGHIWHKHSIGSEPSRIGLREPTYSRLTVTIGFLTGFGARQTHRSS